MKKKLKKIPAIKNDIQGFLLSEEGKISKKNVAKIGLALMAMKMTLQPTNAAAATGTVNLTYTTTVPDHTSTLTSGGHSSNTPPSHTSATGGTCTYLPGGNHGVGGWC